MKNHGKLDGAAEDTATYKGAGKSSSEAKNPAPAFEKERHRPANHTRPERETPNMNTQAKHINVVARKATPKNPVFYAHGIQKDDHPNTPGSRTHANETARDIHPPSGRKTCEDPSPETPDKPNQTRNKPSQNDNAPKY